MTYKNFSILKIILFFVFCSTLVSSSFGEPAWVVEYRKRLLEGVQEVGIDTSGNVAENASQYYKKMFGEHFEFKELYHRTLGQACNGYPINPDNMNLFKDMMIAPYTQFPNWDFVYLAQKYRSDPKTLEPKRYYLAKSSVLSDMLYWEWNVDDIQLRKLETNNGMLLFIKPKDFATSTCIMGKKCIEILMQVTKISCNDPNELQKQFNFPTVLNEGDIFSSIPNFEKITDDFPFPTDQDQWRKRFVGFISKDGICLILIHGRFPQQSIPANPTILDDTRRWLSGRILYKDTKKPVLHRGVTKMPESWKPVLDDNAKNEKWALKIKEQERIKEAKWRVWYDKNGKPLNNGVKMKFDHWSKQSVNFAHDIRFKDGVVKLQIRDNPNFNAQYFPLREFSRKDKKLIMAEPPLKYEANRGRVLGRLDEHGNLIESDSPKPPEPEPDDIE
jgi:hypothetical protein